jgi:hypothetical protein
MVINNRLLYKQSHLRLVTESNIDMILSEMRIRNGHSVEEQVKRVRKNLENALRRLNAKHAHPHADGMG